MDYPYVGISAHWKKHTVFGDPFRKVQKSRLPSPFIHAADFGEKSGLTPLPRAVIRRGGCLRAPFAIQHSASAKCHMMTLAKSVLAKRTHLTALLE